MNLSTSGAVISSMNLPGVVISSWKLGVGNSRKMIGSDTKASEIKKRIRPFSLNRNKSRAQLVAKFLRCELRPPRCIPWRIKSGSNVVKRFFRAWLAMVVVAGMSRMAASKSYGWCEMSRAEDLAAATEIRS